MTTKPKGGNSLFTFFGKIAIQLTIYKLTITKLMKKIYYFILTALLSVVGMTAKAQTITVTVDVDDANRVGIQVQNANYVLEEQTVVTGKNVITMDAYKQLRIYAKSGALLSTVKDVTNGWDVSTGYKSEYSNNPYSDVTYSVTSVSEDEVYTKSFKLTVDDPSINVTLTGSYRGIKLTAGENTVKYDPQTETQVMISPYGGKPLYKVTDGGQDVTAQGNTYYVELSEATDIDVKAAWPADVKFKVSFVFGTEESKNFVSSVSVDGTPVNDFINSFEVQGGSQLSITGNNTEYVLDKFLKNGSSESFGYGQYNSYITGDVVFGITAHKYGTIKVTLNIDDPANVTVYDGYEYNNKIINVVAGSNTVELSEGGNKTITIKANEGCFLTSVSDGTTEYFYSGSTSASVYNLQDGMTVTVKSGKKVREKEATVLVYGREKASWYFNFASETDRYYQFDFAEGNGSLKFGDSDLPFNFGCGGPEISESTVFINGVRAHAYYGQYKLFFDNGATIIIDLDNTTLNDRKTLNIDLEGVEASVISKVEIPNGEAYEWATKGITYLPEWMSSVGFDITITPAAGAVMGVKVDGTPIDSDAEGKFNVTLTKDIKSLAIYDPATGITEVNAETAKTNGKIYTVAGVEVKNAKKGLYIINGKAQVVK